MNRLGERFEVQEVLGRGGFGDVFLARDHALGAEVAIKRLRAPERRRVQRFKQEFRALSQLHHPNLVTLYELLVVDGEWLLVMERLDGRPPDDARSLRVALPGIARGLNALHRAGYLHRDLKAQNLMLTPEGRAVLLDFGVLGRVGGAGEIVGNLMGIAPEQVAGREVGPASDWYALGAILYQTLTGEVPFRGRGSQVLARKVSEDAPVLTPEATPDAGLAELANALLLRDPKRRMQEARRLLPGLGAPAPASRRGELFVGRLRELSELDDALRRARDGLQHVRVVGEPGIGKTALLDAFCRRHPRAVRVRCFEHDGSAYPGLDSVVEVLCARYSADVELSEEQRAAVATLFPGVGWEASGGAQEPVRTRAVAAHALRRLLRAHAGKDVPALILDDVQWGKSDTGRLVAQIVEDSWLVVTASRRDVPPGGLVEVLDERVPITAMVDLRPIDANTIDGSCEVEPAVLARALAQSQGHPLFLSELLHQGGGFDDLFSLLRARARGLPPSSAALMRVLIASSSPLERELASAAHAALQGDDRASFHDVTVLLRERLARVSYSAEGSRLEPAHALIRDACAAELPAGAEVHAALDDAMQTLGVDRPEHQARHALAAGRRERAARLYETAAERAKGSLAFARAATLFGEARDCADVEAERHRLAVARAQALGSAGLHLSAATAFEEATSGRALSVADPDTLALYRQRAEHLLHGGAVRKGERALQDCLRAAGVAPGRTRAGRLASISLHRAWLRTWGASDPPTPSQAPSRLDVARVDLCFAAALAFTNMDTLRGVDFALRSARQAHRLGDRRRFARSYALLTAYSGSSGRPELVGRMIDRVRRFGHELDDPSLRGMAEGARCLLLFHLGRHEDSLVCAQRAEHIFRREAGAPREATTALIYRCANLASLGRYRALAKARLELLEDSVARHDGFGETHARVGLMNLVWLVDDDPERAEEELRRGMERWSEVRFQYAHFFALLAACRVDLYRGKPRRCLERLHKASAGLSASLLLRVPYVRAQFSDLMGRAWLALLVEDPADRFRVRPLQQARRAARRIRRIRAANYTPLAEVIEGGIALQGRDLDGARKKLRSALTAFEALGMRGHAFAAAHALEAVGEESDFAWEAADRPRNAARFASALGLAARC